MGKMALQGEHDMIQSVLIVNLPPSLHPSPKTTANNLNVKPVLIDIMF